MNALDIILLCIGIILVLIIFVLGACLTIVMSWNEETNDFLNPKNQKDEKPDC